MLCYYYFKTAHTAEDSHKMLLKNAKQNSPKQLG